VRAVVLGVVLVSLGLGLGACGDGDDRGALGPGPVTVEVELRHSAFVPERVRVVEGSEVRFVVRNTDPIDHELIVGPDEVHDRHERGTHATHGAVPGEVSVAAGATAETTYRFDDPGTIVVGCHLPRHFGYGMAGEVEVVPA